MANSQLGALFIDLILDPDGRYQAALNRANNQTRTAARSMQNALNGIKGVIAGIGFAAIANESIKAYEGAEKAADKLRSALALTGEASAANVDHYVKLSEEIMSQTIYEHEAVTEAIAHAKALGMQTSMLDKAAYAAVGLTARLGIDLNKSMVMIQRASAGNVVGLSKLGVSFAGCITPAQKLDAVLKYGNEGFKQAQAYANTATGKMAQFKNMIGEAAEALGGALVPFIRVFVSLMGPLLMWLSQISPAVITGVLAAGAMIFVLMNITKWIAAIRAGWVLVTAAISAAQTAAGDFSAVIRALAAATAVVTAFAVAFYATDAQANKLAMSTGDIAKSINELGEAGDNANKSLVKMRETSEKITAPTEDPLKAQAEQLKSIIDATNEATKAEMERRRALIGSIEIADISKKAIEAGLRERFNTTITNQGDLAKGTERGSFAAIRAGLNTRAQFEMAYTKQKTEESSNNRTLQQIYTLLQDKLYSGERGLGYGW